MKMKKSIACRESLASRLAAYSLMAGAALAFLPPANAAIVYPSDDTAFNPMGTSPSACELTFQSQQSQSQRMRLQQKVRLGKKGNARVMSYSGTLPANSAGVSTSSYGTGYYTTSTAE